MNQHFTLLTHDWVTKVFLGTGRQFINSSGRVTIGDNVSFGQHVTVLKGVTIGDNCFIGAGSIILPNVTIGNKVIIGAGSVVTHSIPDNSVAVGNPAKVICTYDDYQHKRENQLANTAVFDESFTIHQISEEKKELMKEKLTHSIGFVR